MTPKSRLKSLSALEYQSRNQPWSAAYAASDDVTWLATGDSTAPTYFMHWDGKALTNLNAPVGATPGYAVVPALRAMGVTVEEEPSHLANLRKLAAGRLDAYAELDNQILPLLRTNKTEFDGIVALSPPVLTKPYYLMFSKIAYERAPEIAERTWDAIAEVNQSAAYQDLLGSAKYAD